MALDFLQESLYNQLIYRPPLPTTDYQGQTIIVTGANTGLGLETARHFTRMGAKKVILAVRSLEKGDIAKQSIEASTNTSSVVEVWLLDLSSYASVKEFVRHAQTLERIDALVENAGISTQVYRVSEDNEATITTNVVSTMLLAILMLPKMRETSSRYNSTPCLTIVSSSGHFFTDLPEKKSPNIFEALNDRRAANIDSRYYVSKLLQVFCARELAAKISQSSEKQPVTVNYVNPGICYSEINRDGFFLVSLVVMVMRFLFARTAERGSRTIVAAVEASSDSHGQYIDCGRLAKPSPFVLSHEGTELQKRVWDELMAKLEVIEPDIAKDL